MITTLTGTNHFLVTKKLSDIVGKFTQQYGDLGIEKIDGEEVEMERIAESLQNLPFLIPKKLIVLRDPSKNKKFSENIEQIISTIPVTTDAVIVESKIDKRHSYYKILRSKTDFEELNELALSDLTNWLVKVARDEDGHITHSDAHYLVDRIGNVQELLFNELKKLLSYQSEVTKETIDLLTEPTPQSTVFDLLDVAFSGQIARTLYLYEEQRRQKVEPLAIMAMISWQLHIFALIKTAGTQERTETAKKAGISPFVVNKSYALAHKLSLDELKKLINQALKLDISLKSQSIDADEALKFFLLSLAS